MDTTPAPIVLITGPPGGGKSTVGRLVAEAFPRSVHIEADVVRESIVGGFEPPVLPFSDALIAQFVLQREIVVEWANRMAAAGYVPVIDDAPIPPGMFEQHYATVLARPDTVPIVVRADGDVIRHRIRARGGPFDEFLVDVVDDALAMLDALNGADWRTVDSSLLDAEQTAAAVVEQVHGR